MPGPVDRCKGEINFFRVLLNHGVDIYFPINNEQGFFTVHWFSHFLQSLTALVFCRILPQMNPFLWFYNAGDNRYEFTAGCLSSGNQTCNCEPQNESGKTKSNGGSGLAYAELFVQPGAADSSEQKADCRKDIKYQGAFKNRP